MKGGDRRARRTGAVVLALLFGTAAAALALTLRYHLGVPGLTVTFLLGLPGLYLGWVTLRPPPDRNLAQVADELATRLRSQWADEAESRGLNEPYPLPVSWTAADPPLAGNLAALKKLATSGAGWSASAREYWAKRPRDLAGGGDRKLADVLAAVPTGRLVMLGEPGTGKTMLMVGLVLDLLHPSRRSSGGPVPVLATLASWNPARQDLHGWLGATLITAYPDLAAAAPPGSAGGNRFEALVEAGLILPVLDGLDEIPESARPAAIARINKELKPGEQVVVTCRTEQYRAAVNQQHGQGAVLRAAAVQLKTLRFGEVAGYLRTDAGPAEGRWDFLDALSAGSPARQALATPLMAGLARAIYNPRPGGHAGKLRDPAQLCDQADRAAIESLLFDEFIPAAYQHDPAGRWKAQDAERWLVFLARHLEQTTVGADIAWWQLQGVVSRIYVGLAFGLGLAFVVGLGTGLAFGLQVGLLAGCVTGWLATRYRGAEAPARGMRISVKGLRARLSLTAGLIVGLGLGLLNGLTVGLVDGLVGGFVTGLVIFLGTGLTSVPGDPAAATTPRAVLARDRLVALLLMLGLGLGFGLPIGLVGGLVAGLVAGFGLGLVAGLMLSMALTAWPSYMLIRAWLALHHRLPWSLMSFLADAHQRGVLRQAGATYQFRHIELQRRLATRP